MKLSHYTQGRDNNFNLVRIVAAFTVLVSHSFILATGSPDSEPLQKILGTTLGTIAVDLFFIASGFLVTASLLTRKSTVEFIWARFLRIFPALLVVTLLSVFVLGPFFTTTTASSYFTSLRTYLYLTKNSLLFAGVAMRLPGVFADNPYPGTVNGSLWTMPYEVRMYALLVAIWLLMRLAKENRFRAFEYLLVALAIAAGAWQLFSHFHLPGDRHFPRLFFAFFTGAAFYVLKEHIPLSRPLFWGLLLALSASTLDQDAFFVVYSLTVAYLLFYLAYVPSGFVRQYNKAGDYSYGVYIYAFPVQQSVAALVPGISVTSLLLVSAGITVALAALSWHLLERHALALKGFYVGHTRRLLGTVPETTQQVE